MRSGNTKNAGNGICLITFSVNADHQDVVYSMFNELYARNEPVFTIGIRNPKSSCAPSTPNNFYYDCPVRPGLNRGTLRLRLLLDMAGEIRRRGIGCLYFESPHLWNAMLMALCPKQTKIVAMHDVIPHDRNLGMAMCNRVTCLMADHIALRNEKYREMLIRNYRLPAGKVSILELWREYPPETPPVHSRRFLYFGRIRKYKGLERLAQVIEHTPDIQYDVVGVSSPDCMPTVRRIAALPNANVDDRSVSAAEMARYFQAADWVLIPYETATQSGVVVDAYKYARPVVAFDVGAIGEQVRDGKTGFLVPEGNVDAFTTAVRRAYEMSPEEYAGFSHAAYAFGEGKYSACGAADRFMDMISRLPGQRRAAATMRWKIEG